MNKIYKIQDKRNGLFSNGIIYNRQGSKEKKIPLVRWNKKGKQWASEELLKKHLMNCIELTGGIPSEWEVMEFTQEPSRKLHEWIDSKMLMKILSK